MKLTDYIIINRNTNIYKAKVELLSSVIAFYSTKNQISSDLMQISSSIENTVNSFGDSHYTKSELKSDFCSKESINNLTSDSTYALTSLAKNKLDGLKSKSSVDMWCDTQKNLSWNILSKEFEKIGHIIKAYDDKNKLNAETIIASAHPPPTANIPSELSTEVDKNEIT